MNDIPDEALKNMEESFGTRLVRHAGGEPEEHFASVFPRSVEEVESLTRLAHTARSPGCRYGPPPGGAHRGHRFPPGDHTPWRMAAMAYPLTGKYDRSFPEMLRRESRRVKPEGRKDASRGERAA